MQQRVVLTRLHEAYVFWVMLMSFLKGHQWQLLAALPGKPAWTAHSSRKYKWGLCWTKICLLWAELSLLPVSLILIENIPMTWDGVSWILPGTGRAEKCLHCSVGTIVDQNHGPKSWIRGGSSTCQSQTQDIIVGLNTADSPVFLQPDFLKKFSRNHPMCQVSGAMPNSGRDWGAPGSP